MAISDKTRKMLWARSGNRCILCKTELVQKSDEPSEYSLVIGEECHIISSKKTGPRGRIEYSGNYDSYNNLILLCANDHKKVDELTEKYTNVTLMILKGLHENWVKETLERDVTAFTNDKLNIKSLPKIKSGKEIVDIINGAHMFNFNHDELKTDEEATEIGELFDELMDTGDILSDLTYSERAKFGLQLNESIEKLEHLGFFLFGLRRQSRLYNDQDVDLGLFDTASLVAVRENNPSIVSEFLIAKFPTKSKLKL